MALTVQTTDLPDLQLVRRAVHADARGSFQRLYDTEELLQSGWVWPVRQVNLSQSLSAGTVRGLHYQSQPHTEAKLVSCVRGAIWDVAVDLRRDSPTFLRWAAFELSAENATSLLIPPGFAHGFQTLSDSVDMVYVHSGRYVTTAETGINAFDERLAIEWPLATTELSPRDAALDMLNSEFAGLDIGGTW